MYRISIRQLLWFTAGIWALFGAIAYAVPSGMVFHVLNPSAIALGVVLIVVFSAAFFDLIKEPESRAQGVTPAHLLTFGIVLNWIGMIIRMGRWYVTGEHPSVVSDLDFWFYNCGLWISLWAGTFLVGSASMVVRPFKTSTLIVIFLCIFGFLLYLDQGIPFWERL